MGMDVRDKLAAELRVDVAELAFLDELDEEQTDLILQGLQAAANRQKGQLDEAVQEALKHIPRVLHGPVRKLLFRYR